MNNETFEQILNERLNKTKTTLGQKAKEYAQDEDRLYNFKRAAEISRTNPAIALWGMAKKHLVSVIDLVEGINCVIENTDIYKARIDEKIGDLINYLILLEAILKEGLIDD